MTHHASHLLETQLYAYDVAMERGKWLLALQALLRGKARRRYCPGIVVRIVDFFVKVEKRGEGRKAGERADGGIGDDAGRDGRVREVIR